MCLSGGVSDYKCCSHYIFAVAYIPVIRVNDMFSMKREVWRSRVPAIISIGTMLLAFSLAVPHVPLESNAPSPHEQVVSTGAQGSSFYAVTFMETGLEPGVQWFVSVNTVDGNQELPPTAQSSTTDKIVFSGPPGRYAAQSWADGHYVSSWQLEGTFQIAGSPLSINISFDQAFPVTVTGNNIPPGHQWEFSLHLGNLYSYMFSNSQTYYNGSTETQYVTNGTYGISAGEQIYSDLNIYSLVGNVTVDGKPVNISMDFNRVNLTASGLPGNTSWGFYGSNSFQLPNGSMYLSDGLYPGIAANVTLFLPNGTVSFQPVAKGYYTKGANLEVSSGFNNVTVEFQKEYPVTFHTDDVLGLLMESWEVQGIPYTFDGHPYLGAFSSSLTYMLPNGTYNVTISFPYGNAYQDTVNGSSYTASISAHIEEGIVTVAGSSQSINVSFSVSYTKVVTPMDRSFEALLIISGTLAVIGALIGAVVLVEYLRRSRGSGK